MIKEKAYAKINLALDVSSKRSDGYHDLKMIMIPLELHDDLSFEIADDIFLDTNIEIEENAIIKTARLMKETYDVKQGAKITLTKRIPMGAGLGGGSADIAATIRGLDQLWNLNLSDEAKESLALSLGSDTLFCLYNQSAYVTGRGEKLLFLETPPFTHIYLHYPKINVSTKTIFSNLTIKHQPKRFDKLVSLYVNEHYKTFLRKTYNTLTHRAIEVYPELKYTIKKLKKTKLKWMMTGSGSTFFVCSFDDFNGEIREKMTINDLDFIETKPKNSKNI